MKKRIRTFSGSKNKQVSSMERAHRAIAREAAAEGIVLLENQGILPLDKSAALSLFGAGAGQTLKGGTGSGDVCVREVISIYQAMKEMDIKITSKSWLDDYDTRYNNAREDWKNMLMTRSKEENNDFFSLYAVNVFQAPAGRQIGKEDCQGSEIAVYVISRIAGEGADRKEDQGDYLLTDWEINDLKTLEKLGMKIVVMINSGGLIDLKEIQANPAVKAILSISQPGMEAGPAVCDILFGEISPSGKLTDTWPVSYDDVANANTFSYRNGNINEEKYEDGIYVGYRYFDGFDLDKIYCFGYGLSYTEFEIHGNQSKVTVDENLVHVEIPVENTGKCAGKEVLQLYAVCPQKKLAKEYRRLVAFAKTSNLQAGQAETLSLDFDAKAIASFDEEQGAWILEAGDYYLLAGNSLDTSSLMAYLRVEADCIIEKVDAICPLQQELTELLIPEDLANAKYEKLSKEAADKSIEAISFQPVLMERKHHEKNKYEIMAQELVEKLTDQELIYMSVGEVSRGHDVALGAAGMMVPGAAGETSGVLEEKYDFPGIAMADGPAGLRILSKYLADEKNGNVYTQGFVAAIENGFFADPLVEREDTVMYYQFCTAFPIGSMLAQTWNTALIEKVGQTVGQEMEYFGISWWLAPGMNIHRNPLCGRNFEYYSEDPTLSGKIAAAMTRGVQSNAGVGTTIKHYACNNLEDNRFGNDSIVSERALREIYLRGFEIAVKESQPMALMSSYNLINGIHAANNKDLLMTVLREEWDFQGMVMTDWTTTQNGSQAWMCPASGNDLIMPGAEDDFESIEQALTDGRLTREELKASVARLVTVIYQTLGFEDAQSYGIHQ